MTHDWLPRALALEADGLTRRAIAEALGLKRGNVLRVLWEHHNPARPPRTYPSRERRGVGQRGVPSWDEARLTETWADRKARRRVEGG